MAPPTDNPLDTGGEPLSRSASSAATERIREAILDGRLAPGDRLAEASLAQAMGISRTPVREALKILQSEGLIESLQNRSARVRVYEAEDLEDMYSLRALLEGYAARRAAERITDAQVKALKESCERFDQLSAPSDLQEIVRENLIFHHTIFDAAGSTRLAEIIRQVIELPLVYRSYVWYSPDQTRIAQHYHRQITGALERHDSERAELIIREHVLGARDVLIAHMQAPGGDTPEAVAVPEPRLA